MHIFKIILIFKLLSSYIEIFGINIKIQSKEILEYLDKNSKEYNEEDYIDRIKNSSLPKIQPLTHKLISFADSIVPNLII